METWKNMETLVKMSHTLKNWSHLSYVTLGKMDHSYKSVSHLVHTWKNMCLHLDKKAKLVKMGHTWKMSHICRKGPQLEKKV